MSTLPQGRNYGIYSGNVKFHLGDFQLLSTQDSITATAGGGQSGAYQLNSQQAVVATVATAGDSIQLPPAVSGAWVALVNHGANAMQVFGKAGTTDIINDQTSTVGVSQTNLSLVFYFCSTAGKWYTEGLGSGFSGGLDTVSATAIAANVAGTQAAGTPITSNIVNTTSAGGSYSVTLPASSSGLYITVNNTSAQTLLVFPNAGGTTTEKINALSANASISMAANTSALFSCVVAGQWYTSPRVPS